MEKPFRRYILRIIVFLTVLITSGALQATNPNPTVADDGVHQLDKWLEAQAQVRTWAAEVVQTRKLKSLARPLETAGKVWFRQPNRFRWQLGDPPRTLVVRTKDALIVAYPRLKQAERYATSGVSDPAWKQVLALLEVGFPSDKATFHARYEMVSAQQVDNRLEFELRPLASQARQLLEKVRLEIALPGYTLLATELEFPDGSTMRNQFQAHRLNPALEEALFSIDLDDGYQVVEPLKR